MVLGKEEICVACTEIPQLTVRSLTKDPIGTAKFNGKILNVKVHPV